MGWQEGYDHRSISSFFPDISCLCRFSERLRSRYLGFIFGGAVMILPGPFPWGCQTSRRCQLPVEELPSVPVASGQQIENRECLFIVFYIFGPVPLHSSAPVQDPSAGTMHWLYQVRSSFHVKAFSFHPSSTQLGPHPFISTGTVMTR
jgi:hypothetical protein